MNCAQQNDTNETSRVVQMFISNILVQYTISSPKDNTLRATIVVEIKSQ